MDRRQDYMNSPCKQTFWCRLFFVWALWLFAASCVSCFVLPASILYKSIAGRYRPVSVADGPITARYRFIKHTYWAVRCLIVVLSRSCLYCDHIVREAGAGCFALLWSLAGVLSVTVAQIMIFIMHQFRCVISIKFDLELSTNARIGP